MPLVNRDKDTPEQRDLVTVDLGTVATGVTHCVWIAPYSAEVSIAKMAALGLSGAPTSQLSISRFIVGSGVTNLGTGGFSLVTLTAYGTSGLQTVQQVASGNSLIQMAAGDILLAVSGGTNSAIANLEIQLAVKCLQDIKSHYGI